MIKICLCEDNVKASQTCKDRMEELSKIHSIDISIMEFNSGESLLFYVNEDANLFDVMIMDMYMARLDGLETSVKMREMGYTGVIIFLTSSTGHAIEAFAVEPLSYVLKEELQEDKFEQVFLRAAARVEKQQSKSLILPAGKNRSVTIPLDTILYLESRNGSMFIVTTTGEREYACRISYLQEHLKGYYFIRCHKMFIVNSQFIGSYNTNEVILRNEVRLPLGRRYRAEFHKHFMNYAAHKMIV